MEWVKKNGDFRVPVKSWCADVEDGAWQQAKNLAKHPIVFGHVALMPDCHQGFGMPIGGVIACKNAVIPNAVGVDIGCGMGAVETSILASKTSQEKLRTITERIKKRIPCGEGRAHKHSQSWDGMNDHIDNYSHTGWFTSHVKDLALRNLGSLGGGNHFIEIQASDDGKVWLMLHSGSRHLGNVIARYYNSVAVDTIQKWNTSVPSKDLAFLPADSQDGQDYIRDMQLAMNYAHENRRLMMENFKDVFSSVFQNAEFREAINIHHNYASLETHFGRDVWIHRKGATSAKENELGIIPGSMGTSSYIVKGLGNIESFKSCSHGAGRVMGRMEASRRLTYEKADKAMRGIVYDRWSKLRRGRLKGSYDFGEAPQAYKDIDSVIQAQEDLVKPLVKLRPLAVVKG